MVKNWRMDFYRAVISFIILLSFHVGHTLRCACEEDLKTCVTIHDMQADFMTAQQICMENGGKLLTAPSKAIHSLPFNKTGHFWIGTEGDCLSSRSSQGDSVTLNRGRGDMVCSSQCMLVSSSGSFTEHSCEDQADGFLCDGIQWETCWGERASEVQILNEEDCLLGPCEYNCEEVPGGHMCSCSENYRPRRNNPERCEYYCDSATCPMLCPMCKCPDGFVKDEGQCTDYDECSSNHNCEQQCRNTIGSYKCSCHEGFVLVNRSNCVPLINPTPLSAALVTPSVNYTQSHAAFATPAEYIGLTLFIIVAASALMGLLYYLQKRKLDVLLKDTDAPDDATIQEAQLQV